jgi:hypothetical protein
VKNEGKLYNARGQVLLARLSALRGHANAVVGSAIGNEIHERRDPISLVKELSRACG